MFTGHSLGREKRRRLLAAGLDGRQIDQQFAMARRIDAEELALAHSQLVVTSTAQERDTQYGRYARFRSDDAQVIPPGVDTGLFFPPKRAVGDPSVTAMVAPFLREPDLPPVLTICRADHRKNIPALVEAFGRSEHLRRHHNLVLVLGCRDDPSQLERQQREVFQQVFELVDRFNLYGQVAYPKQHDRHQIPAIYRWAASLGGLFVNPALTEPFGLTLLEAAASGLPVVATDDGGPRDILARCSNGLLVDASDLDALQKAIESAFADPQRWSRWQRAGIEAVSRSFSWDAHVLHYLGAIAPAVAAADQPGSALPALHPAPAPPCQRLLVLDLDVSLATPDEASLGELRRRLLADPGLALVVSTGRAFKAARLRYRELHLPEPLVWITRAGTEIHRRSREPHTWTVDAAWTDHIAPGWDREAVLAALADFKGRLELQGPEDQGAFKVSYVLPISDHGLLPLVRQTLRQHGLPARPYLFHHRFIDVLPLPASKTEALRFLAHGWGLPLASVLVEASQQGDDQLLSGLTLGVVPHDHDPCLETLRGHRRVYFASKPQAWGLLEGLDHHHFLKR